MKRVAAILVATMMVFSMAACSSEEATEEKDAEKEAKEAVEEEVKSTDDKSAEEIEEDIEFAVEAEFEPNPDYDKYTVIEYNIAGADTAVTVCEKNDQKDFELLCNFYGDDQDWVGTYENGETKMESDKTGFMDGDSAGIIEEAIKQDKWATIK